MADRLKTDSDVNLCELAGQVIALEAAMKQMLSVHPFAEQFLERFPDQLLAALLPYADSCSVVTAAQDTSLRLIASLPRE